MNFTWEQAFTKKVASTVAVLGVAASLHAAPNTSNHREDKPSFAFAYPKDLNLLNPRDFHAYAEGLAFQAEQDGMAFVLKNTHGVGSAFDGSVGGFSNSNNDWGYNFGLRTGLGIYMDHDAWNLDLAWMWLNITEHQGHTATSLEPMWLAAIDTPSAISGTHADANWQCAMNVLDALMGKGYHVSRKLILNPFFGLRFAWLDQTFGADYHGTTGSSRTIFHGKNDFWGVGGRVGINSDWILSGGWKIFSNVASSILCGSFHLKERFSIPGTSISFNETEKYHMNVPNLEIALGLDWGTYLYDHGYYLDFRAGYEFQMWWDQFNLRKIYGGASNGNYANDTVSRGNLALNGFTFKIQLDL
ncbi:MAG: hypothetical protein HY861_03525 [Chlamydiia bacterium]|nr:hypothetical protein [Chlamydiia bacterium]